MPVFRKQNRLSRYDYSQPGYYFVTICTSNRHEFFGSVETGIMSLSEAGKIANEVWLRTPKVYQNIDIDEYVVMPNHLHGVVIIKPGEQATGLHYNLSRIIGSYKNVVAKDIHTNCDINFGWQPSFYDHVIRNNEGLDKIREYIRNNALKWALDRNNPANLWM
jgi:REP element-mobilizing transposase RayT